MYSKRIDDIIERLLKTDERILWHSKPVPHALWRDNALGAMILGVIVTASFSLPFYCVVRDGFFEAVIMLCPFLLMGIFVLLTPWRQKLNFYGKYYLLTSERVLIIEDYVFFHRFFDYKISDAFSIEIDELKDGLYNIDFGIVKCFSCLSFRCVGKDGLVNYHILFKFYFLPEQTFFSLINHLPQDRFVIFKKVNGEWMRVRWENPRYVSEKMLESFNGEAEY